MSQNNILVFSFEDEVSLEQKLSNVLSSLSKISDLPLNSLNEFCAVNNSTQCRLKPKRIAVLGNSVSDLIESINSKSFIYPSRVKRKESKLCFQFTGQGSQYVGMGDGLYSSCSVYRDRFDECSSFLNTKFGIDLARIPNNVDTTYRKYAASLIPTFVLQVCLARTWQSWGILPEVVLNHSLGEYAAAVVCGLMSLEDGLLFLAEECWFARMLIPNARMLVFRSSEEAAQNLMKKLKGRQESGETKLEISVVNSPTQIVLGGKEDVINEFSQLCTEGNIKTRVLPGNLAFHTKLMCPVYPFCKRAADRVEFKEKPEIPYISGMTGKLVQSGEMSAAYLCEHFISKVNFFEATQTSLNLGCDFFVEIGPGPVLTNLTMEINSWRNKQMSISNQVTCTYSLSPNQDDWTTIITNLAEIYVAGWDVNWSKFYQCTITK